MDDSCRVRVFVPSRNVQRTPRTCSTPGAPALPALPHISTAFTAGPVTDAAPGTAREERRSALTVAYIALTAENIIQGRVSKLFV